MFRISAIYDLFAFGEDMGALRVSYNAHGRKELLNKDVDTTMDYLKSVYNNTNNRGEFLLTVLKDGQVNIQIPTGNGFVDSKMVNESTHYIAQGYNEYVRENGVHYWTL